MITAINWFFKRSSRILFDYIMSDKQFGDWPPYQVSVYISPVALKEQVLEVQNPIAGAPTFTSLRHPPEGNQQWNIDPSQITRNEFFVKLASNTTLVLQSPESPGPVTLELQGDRTINGGIQVWIFENYQPGTWRLKNFKTGFYLYLNYDGKGEPLIPVAANPSLVGAYSNADWNVTQV